MAVIFEDGEKTRTYSVTFEMEVDAEDAVAAYEQAMVLASTGAARCYVDGNMI